MSETITFSRSFLLFLLLFVLKQGTASQLKADLPFSEMVDQIDLGRHFENLTIHHPFYEEIGLGTLPLAKFQAFIQQDDLYVNNFLRVIEKLADREQDSQRQEFLRNITADGDSWNEIFRVYYAKYNYTRASQMTPATLDYSGTQSIAANSDYIGIALATLYPCYTLWAKMGTHIKDLSDLETNPYKEFIEAISGGINSTNIQEFVAFVNGYYERFAETPLLQQRMLDAYVRSVELEFAFANANYEATSIESIPPPKFTDLFETLRPELQQKFINHAIWEEIAEGTLPFEKYGSLIRQDDIYFYTYYKAFEIMETKEWNSTRKAMLFKDPKGNTDWFLNQFVIYNFTSTKVVAPYTESYSQHILKTAELGTVAETLTTMWPCRFLWGKSGVLLYNALTEVGDGFHIYKEFLIYNGINPDELVSGGYLRHMTLLNEFYDEDENNTELRYKMIQLARKSIAYEYQFINGIYEGL